MGHLMVAVCEPVRNELQSAPKDAISSPPPRSFFLGAPERREDDSLDIPVAFDRWPKREPSLIERLGAEPF